MRGLAGIVLAAGAIVALAACAVDGNDKPDESAWDANGGEWEGTNPNGEPECVDDVCQVLEMYQGCVNDNPVVDIDLAQAAYVERQCEADDGECCDMGYYISPEAAGCIAGNNGFPQLKYHVGWGAPIWEFSDANISEVHAANGSILSERSAPVAS